MSTPSTGGQSPDVILQVRGVGKDYGATRVLDDLSFDVRRGEVLVILGPSGCGKSTMLRLLAGLERPDAGEILINGKTVARAGRHGIFIPAEKRNVGMVFQSFAIWPHMSVEEHVAFPLKMRGQLSRQEIERRVAESLAFVGLDGYAGRRGSELSGGQQQRLSLARGLVYEPDILLLDEPLSNLDAQLRQQMRLELKKLHSRLGTTFVYVTHDQLEAMTLASTILLMQNGRLQQIGTPSALYNDPTSPFAHAFLGKGLHFEGTLEEGDQDGLWVTLEGAQKLRVGNGALGGAAAGDRVLLGLRPEDLEVLDDGQQPGEHDVEARIDSVVYRGDLYEVVVRACGQEVVLAVPQARNVLDKRTARLRLNAERLKVWKL